MRDDLKTTFYTASPHIGTDEYFAKEVDGYGPTLYTRHGMCVESTVKDVMEGFGYRENHTYTIVLDREDAEAFSGGVNDGLWFTSPTKQGYYYQDPPYIIESVRRVGGAVTLEARKTV